MHNVAHLGAGYWSLYPHSSRFRYVIGEMANEAQLGALMVAGLVGDAASHRTLLDRLPAATVVVLLAAK
jgi:hypothetical protein